MALTPEEIATYELKQTLRGYSVTQVDELLDQLADQVEAAEQERERLVAELREAEAHAEQSQEAESTLTRTLVTAQQAAERSVEEARREAEAIVERAREEAVEIEAQAREEAERRLAEARDEAAREIEEARRHRAALEERLDELVERERAYRARLRDVLTSELEELDRLAPVGPDEEGTSSSEEQEEGSERDARRRGHDPGQPSPLGSAALPHEK